MRRTLDSVVAQTLLPTRWIIVDDGSTDATPEILAQYQAQHDWITVIPKPDRGHRAVGPGVIEAFYTGYDTVDPRAYTYLCKLDLDLDLPAGYFEGLIEKMETDPRLGTCSGKTWYTEKGSGRSISEGISDEMSIGASKFFRTSCFDQIGGFVRAVMWDGIDCHKARLLGWKAASFRDDHLSFEHLRPMGSSQSDIHVGRRRHGAGQYFMGSDPMYLAASAVRKMAQPPFVSGGLSILRGYLEAWWRKDVQYDDPALRAFIRKYQRSVLLHGKVKTVAQIESEGAARWSKSNLGSS